MKRSVSNWVAVWLLTNLVGVAPGCGSDDTNHGAESRGGCSNAGNACPNGGGGASGNGGKTASGGTTEHQAGSAGESTADAGERAGGAGGQDSVAGAGGVGTGASDGGAGEGGAPNPGTSTAPVLIVNAGPAAGPNGLYALALDDATAPPVDLSHAIPPSNSVLGFSVSPDGTHIVFFVLADGVAAVDVYVVDVDGSHTKKLSPDGLADGMATLLGWSKSGASIVFQQDVRTYVARIDGSARFEVPSRDVTWTKDESRVVYANGKTIMVADPDGKNAAPLASSTAPMATQGFSSAGNWLMTTSRPLQGLSVRAWNTTGAGAVDLPATSLTQYPVWSPAADGLYAWLDKGLVALGNVDGSEPVPFDPTGIERFSWSPDGSLLALSGQELIISAVPPAAAPPIHIVGTSITGRAPGFKWSPDGRYIAYAATLPQATNEDVFVQAVKDAPMPPASKMSGNAALNSTVLTFSWSPNSRFVAYQADHRQLGTNELSITELVSDRHIVIGKVTDVAWPRDDSAWSRDGRLLAFQVDSKLTVLNADTFDSKNVEGRLPVGTRSRAFDFAIVPRP